ncbi:MAG: DUF748 domain-containing protein [Desulfobulbaceae bacterium]|jgi:hypothetical protein|nr:DUF748 domain-containing protein [Desulfobulbaceae bacterium]
MPESSGNPDNISIHSGASQKTSPSTLAEREGLQPEQRGKKSTTRKKRGEGRAGHPLIVAIVVLIALCAAYCLAGFLGVPWYLRHSLPELLAHDPRLALDTPNIRFNPFTFTLALDDASIRDDGQRMLTVGAIQAKLDALSLFRSQFVCRALRITEPRLEAVLGEDNRYNLRRLFGGKTEARPENDLLNLAELPFRFALNNVEIDDGLIRFTDERRQNEHILENIRLDIPHVANIPTEVQSTLEPRFSAVFNGSPIELKSKSGQIGGGKTTELACTIRNLEIKRYLSYLPIQLPLAVTKGGAEGDLQLTFAPTGGDLSIDFQLKLIDLELADNDKLVTVTAPTSHLDGVLRPMSGEIAFRNIVTHGFTVATPDGFPWHLTRLLSTPGNNEENGIFSRLLVNNVLADDGSLLRRGERKSSSEWDSIDLRISNYARTGDEKKNAATGNYALAAHHVETGARLRFSGDFIGGAMTGGDLSLEAIPLATLWPWLDHPELSGEGVANIQATLRFSDEPDAKVKNTRLFENGRLEAKKTRLGDWLKAESLKLDGFSLRQAEFSLGKISIGGGETTIDVAKTPEIFMTGFPRVENLDYDGVLTLKDSRRKLPELRFTEVNIQASDLRQAQRPTDKDNVQVRAKLGDKGRFNGRGNVGVFPLKLTLRSDFDDMPTARVLPWYSKNSLLLGLDSSFSGKGNVLLPGAAFRGEISFAAGVLADKKTPYFSWDGLDLFGIRLDRDKHSAIIGEMAIRKPRLSATLDAAAPAARLAAFITRISNEGGKKDEATALEIQKISVKDGAISITDNRPRPAWSGEISAVNGSLGPFITDKPTQAAPLRLTGSLAGAAINLNGSLALLNGGLGDWQLTVADAPIKQFTSQAGDVFGISQDGLISLDLSSSGEANNIRENAVFRGKNLTVASAKSEAALLVALLTNKDGIMTWRHEAQRPGDKALPPVFERGLSSLRELIKKAQTAPFAVAGEENLTKNSGLECAPGQMKFTGDSHAVLSEIRDFLAAHPLLALEVIGCAGSLEDSQALKKELEAEEKRRVAKENARRAAAWQQELRKRGAVATAKEEETDIPPPLPPRFAPVKAQAVVVDNAMLKDLAKRRAELTRNILVNELAVPPERALVGAAKVETGKGGSQRRVIFHLTPLAAKTASAEAKK